MDEKRMDNSSEFKVLSFLRDKSLWLVLFPGYFYLTAYLYKKSELAYFIISPEFVSVDLLGMINAAIIMLGVAVGVLYAVHIVVGLLFGDLPKVDDQITVKHSIMFAFLIMALVVYVFGFDKWMWGVIIIAAIIAFILIVTVFIAGRLWLKKRFLGNGTDISENINKVHKQRFDMFDWLRNKLGSELYGFLLTLVVLGLLIEPITITRAERKVEYIVVNTTPEMFVVESFGNRMICKTFDRSKKTFDNQFCFLGEQEMTKLCFRSENIGPLKSVKQIDEARNER